MDRAAGSLVKHLLKEMERRDARRIGYDLIDGDPEVLNRIAKALGFERVTDTELEVRGA